MQRIAEDVVQIDGFADHHCHGVQNFQFATLFFKLASVFEGKIDAGKTNYTGGGDTDEVEEFKILLKNDVRGNDSHHHYDNSSRGDHLSLFYKTKIQ